MEAITIPTSLNVASKYLQGRKQPGEHYNFRFEVGLPERIVSDLRKINASGGVLPVLQITCERLYRTTKNRSEKRFLTSSSRGWLITNTDYDRLGPLDTHVREYVDESIQDGIAQQLPNLRGVYLSDERDRWKDVLHWMVHKESGGTALSRICSGRELSETAVKKGCRAKFMIEEAPEKDMATFLSNADRRILRKDPRGKSVAQAPFAIIAGPRPAAGAITSRDETNKTKDPDYFSLGHDAIAVDLDTWGAAREVVLKRREAFERLFVLLFKAGAIYFVGFAVLLLYLVYTSDGKFSEVLILTVSSGLMFSLAVFSWMSSTRISRILILNLLFRHIQ